MHIQPRTTPGVPELGPNGQRERGGLAGLERGGARGAGSKRVGVAGNLPGTEDQGPERDVRIAFADAAGVETRLLCWTGLDGAASVRFLGRYP
jgi:hypothetical protein